MVGIEGMVDLEEGSQSFSGALLLRSRRTLLLLDICRDGLADPMPFIVRVPRGSRPESIAEARDHLVPSFAAIISTQWPSGFLT